MGEIHDKETAEAFNEMGLDGGVLRNLRIRDDLWPSADRESKGPGPSSAGSVKLFFLRFLLLLFLSTLALLCAGVLFFSIMVVYSAVAQSNPGETWGYFFLSTMCGLGVLLLIGLTISVAGAVYEEILDLGEQ